MVSRAQRQAARARADQGCHVRQAHPPDAGQQQYEDKVAREQAKWLQLSTNARQLFTDKSSEYIPFDQPSIVVDAIREVSDQRK